MVGPPRSLSVAIRHSKKNTNAHLKCAKDELSVGSGSGFDILYSLREAVYERRGLPVP